MIILDKACAIAENVHLGLWVLASECRWLLGEDLTANRHLAALRKQRDALRDELARLTVVADARTVQTEADLDLLMTDMTRIENMTAQHRALRLQSIRERFPNTDWNA